MPRIYAPSIYMGRIYAAPANFEIQIHIYGVWIPQFAGVAYIRHIYGPHIWRPHIYAPPIRLLPAQVLLPLLRLCPTAAPDLQQLVLLNLTLWLGHSQDDANHRLLSKLFGWQLPICELLNDCAAADDGSAQSAHTTRAFCMQLLAQPPPGLC